MKYKSRLPICIQSNIPLRLKEQIKYGPKHVSKAKFFSLGKLILEFGI